MRDDSPDAVIIRGPVGVGKSATADDLHELLKEANVPHAALDLDWLSAGWPQYGLWNNEQRDRNVTALAASYRAAKAEYFVLAGVVESATEIGALKRAIRATNLAVCRLTAPLSVIEARLRCRNTGERLKWHLDRAAVLDRQLAEDGLDDFVIDAQAAPESVARDVGLALGWLER